MSEKGSAPVPRVLGRYLLFQEIAAGGMATVHVGRLVGPAGFARTVAIKRLHPQFAKDPEFISMFLDEARLAARIRHPNVVSTLDVVPKHGELFLVMEYVQGEALSRLMNAANEVGERMPLDVVSAILCQALLGLHAAHEATSEGGTPLRIVHRDVSPQNILVGTDGVARVVDFGVAKAASRAYSTQEGKLKGKLSYMPPEQVFNPAVLDRRADIFAASVVLWEMLTGRKLLSGDVGAIVGKLMGGPLESPTTVVPDLPPSLDALVARGLARDPADRFPTARAMAQALEAAVPPAGSLKVGEWVERFGGASLVERTGNVARIEMLSISDHTPPHDMGEIHEERTPTTVRHSTVSRSELGPAGAFESTSKPSPEPRPADRISSLPRRVTVGTLAALSLVALLFVALRRGEHAGAATLAEVGAPAASSLAAPAPSPVQALAPPAASVAAAAPAALTSEPPASASQQVSAPARSSTARTSPRPVVGREKPRGCDPPFVLNPDGSKRFKPECFR